MKSDHETFAGAMRMITAVINRTAEGDPADLRRLIQIKIRAELGLNKCVLHMREHGYTDQEIGDGLGITRSAVSKRWPGDGRYVGAAGRYRTT